jgi:hypothetical protein
VDRDVHLFLCPHPLSTGTIVYRDRTGKVFAVHALRSGCPGKVFAATADALSHILKKYFYALLYY